MVALALAIFAGVYILISFPHLLKRPRARLAALEPAPVGRAAAFLLTRAGLALVGGLLMLVAGVVSLPAAVESVDVGTLALLFGMMLLVAGLEVAGFFGVLAGWLVRRFETPRKLLAATMVVTALLSALVLNDAVVLLFTPVLVRAAHARGMRAFPLLAGEATAANIGSAATPMGNPQNAYIVLASPLTFLEFTLGLAPLALACLAAAVAFALWHFRRDLASAPAAARAPLPAPAADRALLAVSLAVAGATVLGFFANHFLRLPLWWIALGGGLALAVIAWPVARTPPWRLLARVDWAILVFFAGLFVLVRAISEAGLLTAFHEALAFLGLYTLPGLTAITAVASNLVSNVPAVVLLAPAIAEAGGSALWLTLAAASTLAGNGTILGAAANVIVAETAARHGGDLDAWRFLKFGLPLTLMTLLLAVLYLPRL